MTEYLDEHLDNGKDSTYGNDAVDKVHRYTKRCRSLTASHNASNQDEAKVNDKDKEDYGDDIAEKAYIFTHLLGDYLFGEYGNRNVNAAIVESGCSSEERHVYAHIAQYLVAPVKGEVEEITKNYVHGHNYCHSHDEDAGKKFGDRRPVKKIDYFFHILSLYMSLLFISIILSL